MTLMSWDEWAGYDAVGLAELVRSRHVTPRELAEQVSRATARVNPRINAVVELFDDAIADPPTGDVNIHSPFRGVPFLMKDAGPAVKGRKQELGSLLMKGNVEFADSFLTTKVRDAGLNIIGRTTTSEFAACAATENSRVYISRNPWNLDYTTGGSSAGSGAIVASGAVPMAHGNDGAGSIRIPAGFNGIVGLKPSRGVFSYAPDASDLLGVVGVQGCLSRTVRDTAAFVDACRGPAVGEFMPYWSPETSYGRLIKKDPPRLLIAISHEWGEHRASPQIVLELERAGKLLESLGHSVEWCTPPVDFPSAYAAHTTFWTTNVAVLIDRLSKARGHLRPPVELIEPMNMKLWEAGINFPYVTRAAAQAALNKVSRCIGAFFQTWDVLLTPVSTLPPQKLGVLDLSTMNPTLSVETWFSKLWEFYAYTPLANLCGNPAISLPLAVHESGLPLGIQAIGAQANDGMLLQLAAQIERSLGGAWNSGRRPYIHVATAFETQSV